MRIDRTKLIKLVKPLFISVDRSLLTFSHLILFQSFFEENPRDLQALRHDRTLHTVKVQEHLGDVPEYIVPDSLKHVTGIATRRKKAYVPKKRKSDHKADNPLMVEGIDYGKQRRV